MNIRFFSISCFTFLLACMLSDRLYAQNMPDLDQQGPAGAVATGQPVTPPNLNNNGNKLNYIRSFVPKIPITIPSNVNESSAPGDVAIATEYRDGFGQTMLQVQHNFIDVSGTLKHLVQPYDTRSLRDQVGYLPYTSTNAGFNVTMFLEQKSYNLAMYPNEASRSYSLGRYRSTAGYRHQTTYAPGLSQVGQYRGTTTQKTSNNTNEVRIWKINTSGLPQSNSYYAANSLIGSYSFDTTGAEVLSYTTKEGNLVYKRVLLHTTVSGTAVTKHYGITYYVSDRLGRLRFILPPKAVDMGGTAPSAAIIQNLGFEYRYDDQGRQIASHQPGEDGFTEIVYDQYDRPVMRQTPLLAGRTQWELTFYDKLGRVIATSLYTSARARDWLQNMLDTTDPESTTHGPTALVYYLITDAGIGKYPGETDLYNNVMMSYTWYDQYGHAANAESRYNATVAALDFTEYSQVAGAETPARSLRTQGMVVGGRSRLLPSTGANGTKTGKWRNSLSWYDDKGRVIYGTTVDTANTTLYIHTMYSGVQHHFSYGPLVSKQVLINYNAADGHDQHTELLHHKYDGFTGRLQQVSHKVDDGDWSILASYAYDGMGRVRSKEQGVGGEVQEYTFNIRGQLTGINGHYAKTALKEGGKRSFGELLQYDYGFGQVRYDGRVSGMVWRGSSASSGPTTAHAYGYDYDRSGRLTVADYNQQVRNGTTIGPWNKTGADYTVNNLSYDKNGNLMSMRQRGVKPGGGVVVMDDLLYKYKNNEASNRLDQVVEAASFPDDLGDFKDGHTGAGDYDYDLAGNLNQDLNKGISSVLNNRFNRPEKVTFTNGNTITYSYDAAGAKLQELRYDAAAAKTTRLDYIGSFVYRNDSLQYLNTPEGRTVFNADSNSFKEEFYVKDHLGNIRSVIDCKVYDIQDYLATYEVASANLENMIFDHHDPIRDDKPGGGGGDTQAGRLNGADAERRVGTALLLKVMTGDQVGMTVNNFYEGYDDRNDEPVDATDMLNSIIATLTTGTGGFGGSESHDPGMVSKMFNTANYTNTFTDMLDSINDPNRPKAYLNYMFFNERMQLVPEASGAFQATGNGTWTEIGSPYPVEMPENGYFAVFLSNSTADGGCYNCGDVFFDQVVITFSKANMLEETHYYPHGLPIVALGSQAHGFSGNRLRYQSNEQLKELNLGWMDFHNRQYDPQIGRFLSVDPLAASNGQDRLSPFQAMGNNPVSMVDPLGLSFTVSGDYRMIIKFLNDWLGKGNYELIGNTVYLKEGKEVAVLAQLTEAFSKGGEGGGSAATAEQAAQAAQWMVDMIKSGEKHINADLSNNGFLTLSAYAENDADKLFKGWKELGDRYGKATFLPATVASFAGTKAGKALSVGGGYVYKSSTYSMKRRLASELAIGKEAVESTVKGIGIAGGVLTLSSDLTGVYQYYKSGPESDGAVSPFHATVNTAASYISIYGGWQGGLIGGAYFLVEPIIWSTPGSIPALPVPAVDNTFVTPR